MKRIAVILVLFTGLSSFITSDSTFRVVKNDSFSTNEKLEYKVKFGAFTIGSADVEVYPQIYRVNDRKCYKVKVFGRTTGAADVLKFSKVRDTWITYIDKESIISQKFFTEVHEGNYYRKETTYVNHLKGKAQLKLEKKKSTRDIVFDVPKDVQDLISGYYYLRTLDYSKYNVGDMIKLDAFLTDELYDFKVRYMGTTTLKMKEGKIKAIKLMPVIPENSYFKNEDAVTFYISNDVNRVPLFVEADMFIANIKIILKDWEGLQADLQFSK